MTLYSYIVRRDYGFAPNPFHGYCTLATCKHVTRRVARPGDWIIGTGSKEHQRQGQLIYAMRVTERLSFDEYWSDPRFVLKRPDLTGSTMRWYGDNIYHEVDGIWVQEDSHHSLPGGEVNPINYDDDLKTKCVLVSNEYWYFGRDAPIIPDQFRGTGPDNILSPRGHKKNFTPGLTDAFLDWVRQHPPGPTGRPDRWT